MKKFDYIAGTKKQKIVDTETGEVIEKPEDGFIIKGEIYTAEVDDDGKPINLLLKDRTISRTSLLKMLNINVTQEIDLMKGIPAINENGIERNPFNINDEYFVNKPRNTSAIRREFFKK